MCVRVSLACVYACRWCACVYVSLVCICVVSQRVRVSVPVDRVCLCHEKPKKMRTQETSTATVFARHRTITLFFFPCSTYTHVHSMQDVFYLEFYFRLGDVPTAVISTRHQTLTLFLCVVSLSLPGVREGICMNVRVYLCERE